MAQTTKKKSSPSSGKKTAAKKSAKQEEQVYSRIICAGVCLALGIFGFIAFFEKEAVLISLFRRLLTGLFGWGFFLCPFVLVYVFILLAFMRNRPAVPRLIFIFLSLLVVSELIHLIFAGSGYALGKGMVKLMWTGGQQLDCGGVLGGCIAEALRYLLSRIGSIIVLLALLIFFAVLGFDIPIRKLFTTKEKRTQDEDKRRKKEHMEQYAEEVQRRSKSVPVEPEPLKPAEPARRKRKVVDVPFDMGEEPVQPAPVFDVPYEPDVPVVSQRGARPVQQAPMSQPTAAASSSSPVPPAQEPEKPKKTSSRKKAPTEVNASSGGAPEQPAVKVEQSFGEIAVHAEGEYEFPPLDLLAAGSDTPVDASEEIKVNCQRLDAAFRSFGVKVRIASCTHGPTVTRYEAEIEAGVKLSRITGLADDIALALGVEGVRIAAMPDMISTVGIEVPNKTVSAVNLRDVIDSPTFRNAKSKLTFAIGKNIGGEAVVGNIAKLPHLLVAGTTGSGKSVCLNSLILSILYKATPEEVRFIMVDPKMVEFVVYNGIPHLLVPVVTDAKKAAGALQWGVVEMMKRYRLFAETMTREIEGYNKIMEQTGGEKLYKLVVIIDELADLMMTSAKEVEDSIVRIAQMGRAAGIHLVIATQSPRADIITGLMKANIPSRIALKVASSLESRIILDAGGAADKLEGNGDMLYAPIGSSRPVRLQGTWVTDDERESIVEFIKKQSQAQYEETVINEIDKAAEEKEKSGGSKSEDEPSSPMDEYDELLPQAVDVILESGQASVSMLQRRLKLGYSRAARIVDQMEELGIVGQFEGAKARQVKITREQWREMQYINGTAPVDILPEPDTFEDLREEAPDID